ncbi:MAG: DUF1800 domain-containing protein [Bryobacteraceae bacterium]|nr:DUF1800 domain-containing protein [Bryobacteraceae bacterium]
MRKRIWLALMAGVLAAAPANKKLDKDLQVRHALSRLTFGERPGDFEAVKKTGLKKWIARQLDPASIPENPKLEAKLADLPSLAMTREELAERYPIRERRKSIVALGRELLESKIYRAVYSERQLSEVLADFWFNHFNVHFEKGLDRYLVTAYERDAIRPHVLGDFRTMLEATAKDPAMLFYLDNWQSVGPDAPSARFAKGRRRGLNENYARELMELHTLGVDGGYSQKDVTEVARCFTGWTIERPAGGAKFRFDARSHDRGEKIVLGTKIPAGGGVEDGLKVLDILARHPATAKNISTKLAQRFAADEPPPALVAKMAAAFSKTGGDLRAVMKAMLDAPEFWTHGVYRAKVKSPLEMAVGAVRASNAELVNALPLAQRIAQLGQPLYRKAEPTGYPNTGEEWLSSAGLVARMNLATALAGNRLPGVRVTADESLADRLGGPEFQKR